MSALTRLTQEERDIAEARVILCNIAEDIGTIAMRLREIEQSADAMDWEEISDWFSEIRKNAAKGAMFAQNRHDS
jgi:hypothetical protein